MRPSVTALIAGLLLATTPLLAQAPAGIVGADIQLLAGAPLEAMLLRLLGEPATGTWLGYEVPKEPGQGEICCFNSAHACCGGCRLESGGWYRGRESDQGPIRLQSRSTLRILIRLQNGSIEKVRTFSSDCALDAEGARLVWLGQVDTEASLGVLAQLAEGSGSLGSRLAGDGDGCRHAAVAAIAGHAGNDPLERLLDWGRHARQTELRKQSVFWLAQRAGERAAATIENAVLNDPDEDVKAQAVFALSQLPPDRGVPLLIRIARTHRVPRVRKQALFWLGQTEDDRALDFIEEILSRR